MFATVTKLYTGCSYNFGDFTKKHEILLMFVLLRGVIWFYIFDNYKDILLAV